MQDAVELVLLQYLVERSRRSDIFDNCEFELVFSVICELFSEVRSLGFRADGANDVMATLEEGVDDMDADKAVGASEEDGGGGFVLMRHRRG